MSIPRWRYSSIWARGSVLVGCLVEFGLLFVRGFLLILGLPLVVWHAVDEFAALFSRERHAMRSRCVFHPIRKTIAAEAGKIHQVDVLHVRTRPQMLYEPAECRGFELGLGLFIKGH